MRGVDCDSKSILPALTSRYLDRLEANDCELLIEGLKVTLDGAAHRPRNLKLNLGLPVAGLKAYVLVANRAECNGRDNCDPSG